MMAAFWEWQNVPHLDLLPVFKQHDVDDLKLNDWDGHPNEFANLLIADAVQEFLQTEGYAPQASQQPELRKTY